MRMFISLVAFLLGAVPLAGLASSSGTSQADACWNKAYVAGNVEAVTRCYAPDAVQWMPGGPMAKGRKAIHDGYAHFFAAHTVKGVVLKEMGSHTVGNDAVGWGTYSVTYEPKGGGPTTTETGRYTEVARRVGGHWVYVVDHASADPAPTNGKTP